MSEEKRIPKEPTYMKYGFIPRASKMPDLQARDVQDEGKYIEGHAAVFNQMTNIGGYFNEVIRKGAFDACDFSDVLFSTNHDLDKIPLARSRNNNANSTLQLKIDDQGLFVRALMDLDNNMEAKALYSAVGRTDISGMSFIFRISDYEWENLDTDMPTRYINKISKVIEVSAVSWPAYSGTDISNARDAFAPECAQRELESARKVRTGKAMTWKSSDLKTKFYRKVD